MQFFGVSFGAMFRWGGRQDVLEAYFMVSWESDCVLRLAGRPVRFVRKMWRVG